MRRTFRFAAAVCLLLVAGGVATASELRPEDVGFTSDCAGEWVIVDRLTPEVPQPRKSARLTALFQSSGEIHSYPSKYKPGKMVYRVHVPMPDTLLAAETPFIGEIKVRRVRCD